MAIRVAVNGYGRIGRLAIRALFETARDDIELVAVNSTAGLENSAYLLYRDSVHGTFNADINTDGGTLNINDKKIKMFSTRNPEELNWGDLGVDIVYECTGKFNSKEAAQVHLQQGAKKVLCSAPAKNADITVVYGVNHDQLNKEHLIVSNASCTTNCLAPVAKVLDENFGIEKGFMTTVHAYTGDQRILDANHKDPRRARACAMSIIPTSTGAAKAVALVLPQLAGKLDGTAVRIPTPNVSMIDLTFNAKRDTSVEEVNAAMKAAAEGPLKGVLGYVEDPTVSIDYNHDVHSSSFDSTQTQVMGGNFVRVLSWYDNEWGFSVRMNDTAAAMAKAGF